MNNKLSNLLKGITFIFAYFLLDYFVAYLLTNGDITKVSNSTRLQLIINIIKLTSIAIFIIAVDFKEIKRELLEFKKKYDNLIPTYIKKVFYGFLVLFGVKICCGIVSTNLVKIFGSTVTDTENQQLIESLLGKMPSLMILSACVLAPIVEEFIFRGAIRKVLKNKGVFIAVSGITFGLVHISGSFLLFFTILMISVLISEMIELIKKNEKLSDVIKTMIPMVVGEILIILTIWFITTNYLYPSISIIEMIGKLFNSVIYAFKDITFIIELINDIPYIGMGIYLAYVYTKEENITINIGIHALNNIIGVIVLLLV